jgi:hypothetical protein
MVAYLFLFSVLLQTEFLESGIDLFNIVSYFVRHTVKIRVIKIGIEN